MVRKNAIVSKVLQVLKKFALKSLKEVDLQQTKWKWKYNIKYKHTSTIEPYAH